MKILNKILEFIFFPVVVVIVLVVTILLAFANIFIVNGKIKLTTETYGKNNKVQNDIHTIGPYGPIGKK